ncbi:MAG: GMC family oxidoreductase [Leptonema illini]|uniref:Cholesterol oxidase n=1 Tax=Leptonema illini TaxID=183 RepID=A0A833H203_9LEPT|nr:MAG: GMC family oxidoreductase [Leptonema illini]
MQKTYDYIVIGSGFGGSVSALRLAQKGYSVAVLEAGKRYRSEDFPRTNWSLKKFLWIPALAMYGIQRINLLKNVLILSGAGVGGGSLVYANTLYVPLPAFFDNPIVKKMGGDTVLLPFYELAKKMLGVEQTPRIFKADEMLRDTAVEMGFGDTFKSTPAGVYFGTPDTTHPDPYFGGEGPERVGCNYCGGCMVGCRNNSKNTLDKNYLFFAERLGVEIIPETKVVDIVPQNEDGSQGYTIHTKSSTGSAPKRTFQTKGIVLSAGVLGTMKLLWSMKQKGRMPRISDRLGHVVRTNSESIIGVTARSSNVDYSHGIAITSSVFPDPDTHIEPVRYPEGSDAMNGLAAPVMVDGGGWIPRQIRFLFAMLLHPIRGLRLTWPVGFAKRSIILLVMQSVDNYISIQNKRTFFWPWSKILTTKMEKGGHLPSYIPIANEFARALARRMKGYARSSINEVLLDIPTTAHILGGAVIGETPEEGVIDLQNRLFGYENFIVCDGSMVPANLGVNPSLTITALSERAMSLVPPKSQMHHFGFEKSWNVTTLLEGALSKQA